MAEPLCPRPPLPRLLARPAVGSFPHAPFHLSFIHPSGTHSAVFWESQYKQWEFELVMVTRLVSQGCELRQAHDYQHLHHPQCAHTHPIVSPRSEPLCESES